MPEREVAEVVIGNSTKLTSETVVPDVVGSVNCDGVDLLCGKTGLPQGQHISPQRDGSGSNLESLQRETPSPPFDCLSRRDDHPQEGPDAQTAALQTKPEVTVGALHRSQFGSHARLLEDDQGGADHSIGRAGRDSSQGLDQGRDCSTHHGDSGRPGTGSPSWKSSDTSTSLNGGAQPGFSQEIRSTGVCPQQDDAASHRSGDHSSVAEGLHQQDLCHHHRTTRGSSGVWRTLQPHLRGAQEHGARLCSLGGDHCQRGRMQPSLRASGTLAGDSDHPGQDHGQDHPQEDGAGNQGLHRIRCGIRGELFQHGSAGDDDEHGQDDVRAEGGSRSPSSREASKEGGVLNSQHGLFHQGGAGQQVGAPTQCPEQSSLSSVRLGRSHSDLFGQWEPLPESKTRHLSQCADMMIPEAFSSLTGHKRVRLLEVACSPTSVLTETMQQLTGDAAAAQRCSLFNEYDLTKGSGVKRVIQDIEVLRPEHVWLSPICGPFSVMQNINQRTEQQKEDLTRKRNEALKQYVGCSIIFKYCIQLGIHVSWEWSQSCQAWRLPLIQGLIRQHQPFFATVRGCQVGLKNSQGQLLSKGWKIMTTHELLSKRMELPCRCSKEVIHAKCEGSETSKTAYYTKQFATRVCRVLLQGVETETLKRELAGNVVLTEGFGNGGVCSCTHGKHHGVELVCGWCHQQDLQVVLGEESQHQDEGCRATGRDPPKAPNSPEAHVTGSHDRDMSTEEIRRKLYLLHAATGHGPVNHLIQALRRRGVSQEVMNEAKKFKCSVCEERRKVQPRPLSTLEPHPPKWSTVSGDVGHWIHPHSGQHVQFLMFVDEGSRFRIGRVVLEGKRTHVNAPQFISTFKESWTQYFGLPHTLRVDPDGTFRSTVVQDFCDQHHIHLDIIPGEAHWKLGICEQAIQGTKNLMTKLAEDDPDITALEALADATRVFNNRDLIRGYSPIQHAVGRAPDSCGRFFPPPNMDSPDLLVENATGEMSRQLHRMQIAEKAFLDWTAHQRLLKAKHSRPRTVTQYVPGDLVYIWRKQVSGQSAVKGGSFIGPARILAVEKHQSTDGTVKEGSSIWCVRGRRLLKCSPEQLRKASEKETLLSELEANHYEDWDFHRVAQELGGNEYLDVSSEIPDEQEWQRAQDPTMEWQPTHRCRGKKSDPERPRARSRSPREPHQAEVPDQETGRRRLASPETSAYGNGETWWEQSQVQQAFSCTETAFWTQETAAVSVEIDMPQSRASSERALKDLPAFFSSSLKRRSSIEIIERHLSPEEKEMFRSAKSVEVTNFVAAQAFEALPDALKPSKNQAIRMRWILTWKYKEDGSKKAKARAVLLGYQDPCYEQRSTHSPTTTRQTRQLQLMLAASLKFKMREGDVTGAFLQSRPYPGELYCIPCPEICEAMGLPPESITRVRKACYGLVDAPLEWYRSVSEYFHLLGLKKLWSDACCWVYVQDGQTQGIISGHVDDFLFSGNENHAGWLSILESIKKEYKWSDWEDTRFVQCGVLVEQHSDFSFSLSQEKYVEDLKYINLRAHRKKDKSSPTDAWEKTQLRALLGGISWYSQQIGPHASAEVSLLLSDVNSSTVETIYQANKLLDRIKGMKDHRMEIKGIPPKEMALFVWVDAAAQNRHDGSSTQGIIVGAASNRLLQGTCEHIALIAWHSQKIDRKCRSPGAAEAVAAINGEDCLYYARFQLSEMLGFPVDIRNVDESVNRITGCVVTDSRNVFDKLETEVLSIKGAEKRTDIELLALKGAQLRNGVLIRWVHGEAQLANGLTKLHEYKELLLFYRMKFSWRIVEDEDRASARKRKTQGLKPLESRPKEPISLEGVV